MVILKLIPGVRIFMDASIKMAREKGYVETMYGRRDTCRISYPETR